MRSDLSRVVAAFRRYAGEQGWSRADYRLWIEAVPEWGQIHTILAARQSPPTQDPGEWWVSVLDTLEQSLGDDPDLLSSVGVVVRTFDEVEQGGLSRIPSSYLDADELLNAQPLGVVAGQSPQPSLDL